MSDEARHVAFGVLSLQEYYKELTDAEMLDRQEFTFEAAVRMRDRFLQQEVWERMGVPVKDAVRLVMADEGRKEFQASCSLQDCAESARVSASLDRNKGWLRQRFTELGVIQFEDWVDTGEEYAMLDEVSSRPRSRRRLTPIQFAPAGSSARSTGATSIRPSRTLPGGAQSDGICVALVERPRDVGHSSCDWRGIRLWLRRSLGRLTVACRGGEPTAEAALRRGARLASSTTALVGVTSSGTRQRGKDGAHLGHREVLADATSRSEPEREQRAPRLPSDSAEGVSLRVEAQRIVLRGFLSRLMPRRYTAATWAAPNSRRNGPEGVSVDARLRRRARMPHTVLGWEAQGSR